MSLSSHDSSITEEGNYEAERSSSDTHKPKVYSLMVNSKLYALISFTD